MGSHLTQIDKQSRHFFLNPNPTTEMSMTESDICSHGKYVITAMHNVKKSRYFLCVSASKHDEEAFRVTKTKIIC